MKRRILSSLLLMGLAVLAGHAGSEEAYPNRPIKLIVHTTAGSASDATARLVAEDMGRRLGQQMVVDNRAGAGGSIGVDAAAKAAADGYTLLVGASSVMVMLPAVSKRKLPYDADADFAPIGRVAVAPFLLVVNSKSGIKSLAELVAAAKASPGKLSYASAGAATNPHMLGEMLSLVSGTSLNHVPYKGPGPAQVDLLGGSIDMQFDTPSATLQLIKAGKLRALAVTGSARLAALPDVATVGELGYPQLQLLGWTGLYAPRGVPPAVLAKLQETLKETLKSPQVRAGLLAMGSEPDAMIGDELLQEQRKSRDVWRKLALARNIALD